MMQNSAIMKMIKLIKGLQLETIYVLNHIALYFSRDLPLNSVTDVGDWKLELVNAEVEIFVYQKFFL